jgi:Rhodopirellula transposase DDE domain
MYREGKLYTQKPIKVYDHDFPHLADMIAIPHGVYDIKLNVGYVTIGTSHDTSEFACDCLLAWWQQHGRFNYPKTSSILLLCDSGGSNNPRTYLFKHHLQRLVDQIGIEIRVAHYPPYTSKYNPIEHRLFPHVSRACRGVILRNMDIFLDLVQTTKTETGLKVFACINEKIYQTKRKITEKDKNDISIISDRYFAKWNYTAVPCGHKISSFNSFVSINDNLYQTNEILDKTKKIIDQIFSGI